MSIRAAAAAAALLAACASTPSAKDRKTAEIHHDLGLEALNGGRMQDALKEFDEALKHDENFADAHLGRGVVLEHGFSRLDDAEKAYRRALELRPSFSEAHNNLGQVLMKRGDLAAAVAEFDRALENMLYKTPYFARYNKASALERLGRREAAVGELKACLDANPRFCACHRMLGVIRLEEGNGPAAVESFDRYAEHCPQFADAWLQLGLAHLRSGNEKKAVEAFDKCETTAKQGEVADDCRRRRAVLQ
jgi:type IV pilus biogenesis/stability protein PilW